MDLDSIGIALSNLALRGGPDGLIQDPFFIEISSPSGINSLLEMIRADTRLADRVGKESYHHPNGFDKLVLWREDADALAIVVHVWWPSDVADDERVGNVHDHRWNFASRVITGALEFEEFAAVQEDGEPMHEFEYSSPGGAGTYGFNYVGRRTLRRIFGGRISAGTRYWLDHRVLHRAWGAVDDTTITLVVQFPVSQPQTHVLRASSKHPTGAVPLDPLEGDALQDTVERMLMVAPLSAA